MALFAILTSLLVGASPLEGETEGDSAVFTVRRGEAFSFQPSHEQCDTAFVVLPDRRTTTFQPYLHGSCADETYTSTIEITFGADVAPGEAKVIFDCDPIHYLFFVEATDPTAQCNTEMRALCMGDPAVAPASSTTNVARPSTTRDSRPNRYSIFGMTSAWAPLTGGVSASSITGDISSTELYYETQSTIAANSAPSQPAEAVSDWTFATSYAAPPSITAGSASGQTSSMAIGGITNILTSEQGSQTIHTPQTDASSIGQSPSDCASTISSAIIDVTTTISESSWPATSVPDPSTCACYAT